MLKLLEFQKRVTPIVKDSKNPFYKSKYFDINSLLAEIRPILNELGLVLSQPLSTSAGRPALRTLLVDVETGKTLIDEDIPLPENNDPQKMGATITYFRRYALQSMLCLEAEDDDAESVVRSKPTQIQAINLLKTKLVNLGAKTDEEACELIMKHAGVPVKSMKDLTEESAKQILELFN